MAKYEYLPIFQSARELTIRMEWAVRKMSRYDKYVLGTELRKRAIKTLSLVIRANNAVDKIIFLEELKNILEELRQLLFIAKETRTLASYASYKELMEKVVDISKQNEGWLRSQKKKKGYQK